jgi:hypothetical protein
MMKSTGLAAVVVLTTWLGIGVTAAQAVTYRYDIDAWYQLQPVGPNNSLTGSFTIEDNDGATISNINIQATLPYGLNPPVQVNCSK